MTYSTAKGATRSGFGDIKLYAGTGERFAGGIEDADHWLVSDVRRERIERPITLYHGDVKRRGRIVLGVASDRQGHRQDES